VSIRIPLFVCVMALLTFGAAASSRGDIVVRVEVKESGEKADPATALTVETLAGATGQFATKTAVGKDTVELKGDVKKSETGEYRVRVTFKNTRPAGAQEVSTNVILSAGKPKQIGGLQGAGTERSVVLTLEEPAAAAAAR
jgi:hypothetical protein